MSSVAQMPEDITTEYLLLLSEDRDNNIEIIEKINSIMKQNDTFKKWNFDKLVTLINHVSSNNNFTKSIKDYYDRNKELYLEHRGNEYFKDGRLNLYGFFILKDNINDFDELYNVLKEINDRNTLYLNMLINTLNIEYHGGDI